MSDKEPHLCGASDCFDLAEKVLNQDWQDEDFDSRELDKVVR